MLLQHVPDRGEHLVRYSGWYSHWARGTRKVEMADAATLDSVIEGLPEHVDPEASRAARAALARLIKKVYKGDPLGCPHCGGEVRFLSVIEEPVVIEHILHLLGLLDPRPPGQALPQDDDWPINDQISPDLRAPTRHRLSTLDVRLDRAKIGRQSRKSC